MLLTFFRKGKAAFSRLRLHTLFEPVSRIGLPILYLSRLSRWIDETPMPEFDDFYSNRHDYNKRYELYRHIVDSEDLDAVCYLEFGVSRGTSFEWWISNIRNKNAIFIGFDTFTGLPEDWGHNKKGAMSTEGKIPDFEDGRCRFIKGIFQEILPDFLDTFETKLRKVIHLDADLYSSTLFVLTSLYPILNKGDILIFDEFNVPMHEFRAYKDFVESYRVKTEVIGAVNNYYQTAFKIV